MANHLLHVYLGARQAGELEADPVGRMTFRYLAQDPASALSLSLPPRTEPYDDTKCRPFFAGLLPEGAALQKAAESKRLQVYEIFKLLRAFGAECAGAVRLLPPGEAPQIHQDYELLEGPRLVQEIRAINQAPNFARDQRVRLSVAGVQSKTAVRITEEGIFKPLNGSPSTHLLKVGTERYPDLPKNEAFCLQLAARLDIPTANVELKEIDSIPVLLVRRYDRSIENGIVVEQHQEDFCQALGYPPAAKYEIDEDTGAKVGPGLSECADLIRKTRRPAADLQSFIRRVFFNFLVGNADAHAKNLSLLYTVDTAGIGLAPLYDVVCTRLYPNLNETLAMRHGGVLDPGQMSEAAWDGLARDLRVSPALARRAAAELARAIVPEARALMRDGFTQFPPYSDILSAIGERAQKLSADLELGVDVDTPPFMLHAPSSTA